MFRKYEERIQKWIDASSKALLIYGARQVGKTYLIRKVLEKNNINFFEINLIEETKICEALSKTDNAQDIENILSLYSKVPLKEKESVIFFDEIQQWPEIVTKIKFLVDRGTYRYILSGSNLGIELKGIKSVPIGYVEQFQMFPMDFKEFSLALGVKENEWDYLKDCFDKLIPIDEIIHQRMMKLFRFYLVCGGMPAVVETFREKHTLLSTYLEQQNIINQYKADFVKYEAIDRKLRIISIYDSIPSQLNKQDRRFVFVYLNKELKFDRYENSFLWLKDASVSIPVYIANEPRQPLEISRSTNKFKLFQSDVGLLTSFFPQDCRMDILENLESFSFNCGALFENFVAQELFAQEIIPFYYKKTDIGEIDFLIEQENKVIPIEVKSGKDYKKHASLNSLLNKKEYEFDKAFVLCPYNIEKAEHITYLPIYMTSLLKKEQNVGFFTI